MRSLVALVVLVCACLALAQQGKVCQFSSGVPTTYDSVYACYYSVPIDQDVKAQTIGSLRRALQLYTFLDIAIESPTPQLPVNVDMMKVLDDIEQRPYKFDFDFQDDLRGAFLKLYDAHTNYYPPTCYSQMNIRQPFNPISYTDAATGQQVIAVGPWFSSDLVQYYQQYHGVNVKEYAGAQIVEVDGSPSFTYFYTYANESVGISKDPGTRFNMVMTRPEPRPDMVNVQLSYWSVRSKRNPVPRRPVVDYTFLFANGTTQQLSLPWSFVPLKTYGGLADFMKDYWAPVPTADADREDALGVSGDTRFRFTTHTAPPPVVEDMALRDPVVVDFYPGNQAIKGVDGQEASFINLVNGTELSFWQLSDNETLVMYLDTFGPSSLVETYKILNEGFEAAAERNLSRFIIDLTNNGGGSICLGRSLIAYLQANGTNYGPEDLICSELQKELTQNAVSLDVTNSVWSPSFYADHQDNPISQNDTSYLIPGVPHVRGGKLRNYTRLVHIADCGNFGYRIDPAIKFAPDEIIIVTHGFCGSTCALFSTHLALYDSVRTMVFGGINGQEQQFFSFPGGQVLDTPGLFTTISQLGFDTSPAMPQPDELQPRALPTTAAYRFCVREVYPNTPVAYSTPPMEFSYHAGSYRSDYTPQTAVAPEYGWYQAAAHFGPGK